MFEDVFVDLFQFVIIADEDMLLDLLVRVCRMLTDESVLGSPFTVFAFSNLSTRVKALMTKTIIVQELEALTCGHVNKCLA